MSILLVEDDVTSASALRAILVRRGCNVDVAITVAEAEALLIERSAPDWIILDLMLPDGDGTQVLLDVQRQNLPTKVIITTAVSDLDRLQQVKDLRPVAVLRKPINLNELLGILGLRGV